MKKENNKTNNKFKKIQNSIIYSIKYIWMIDKIYILLLIISSFLTSAANIFNVYILKYLTDIVITQNKTLFPIILFIMIAVAICINLINTTTSNCIYPILTSRINKKIQQDIYIKSQDYDIEYFNDSNFYNIYYFILQNSRNTIMSTTNMIGTFLTNIISIGGIVVIVSKYDYYSLIIVLTGVIMSALFSMKLQKNRYNYNLETVEPTRKINYIDRIFYLNTYLKEIRTYRETQIIWSNYSSSWKEYIGITKKWRKKISMLEFFENTINSITYFSILSYLACLSIFNYISISTFMVLFNGAQQLIYQIKSIISIIPSIYSKIINMNKYFEFMEMKKIDDEKDDFNVNISSIELENISFSYPNSRFSLQNINLKLGNNIKKVAIVGKNGSGKSTIVNLLMGFYKPNNGIIKINGADLQSYNIDSYLKHVSVVYQDFQLFSFTIAQNIMMKHEINNSDEKVINHALKLVGLYDKVANLKYGMHTCISKEFDSSGTVLSGGELQKLALARAYVRGGDVFIMDEPFSSFDAISENIVTDTINEIIKDKISIIISHSLINLCNMDLIVVLDNGKIVEFGKQNELLKNKGLYAEMYNAQVKRFNNY